MGGACTRGLPGPGTGSSAARTRVPRDGARALGLLERLGQVADRLVALSERGAGGGVGTLELRELGVLALLRQQRVERIRRLGPSPLHRRSVRDGRLRGVGRVELVAVLAVGEGAPLPRHGLAQAPRHLVEPLMQQVLVVHRARR